jgi:hypothetical protein
MTWPTNLLDLKLRDDIKIPTDPGTKPVNKALHDAFQNAENYQMLENSTNVENDLEFILNSDAPQSATATIFRAYVAKTVTFRNNSKSGQHMDEQTMRKFVGADQLPTTTTSVFDDHAPRDGNTFKLGEDLKDIVGIFSSRGTCAGLKAALFTKAIELFTNKREAEELKTITEGPNSSNTIAAKRTVQNKFHAFYEAANRGVSDALAAYANEGESVTKSSGLVKSCGLAPGALITPHEWLANVVKYEAYGKWVDETGCYSWRMKDPKRDAFDHFMDAERVLKRFRQTDIPDSFKDNNALVEAAYAFKDNEAAAQSERQMIKRQADEICSRNSRPRLA